MSASSPRRGSYGTPASPRHARGSLASRLPSFNENEPRANVVLGFSPPSASLSTLAETPTVGSPRPPALALQTNYKYAHLSPQLSTPIDQGPQSQLFQAAESPRFLPSSPHGPTHGELPPRSRRNSAAIVSISLSSRSRSRTPRGKSAQLPGSGSGHATPNKGSSSVTPKADEVNLQKEVLVQMGNGDTWANDNDAFGDWQPTGGMLLGSDEEAIEDDSSDDGEQQHWALDDDDDNPIVKDVLSPGMLFGEGLEFQGEIVEPAVGRLSGDDSDGGMPLRRGGSEAPKALRGKPGVHHHGRERKSYEVIRQLGSGSYAVVYLVKERGGRKREYALKCLSKENLEPEQIDTQLFEATIHLSLPIHKNIVTLHQTLQTKKWLFLMLELCPGEDLFYWLEKSRDASPPPANAHLPDDRSAPMSSSKFSSSSIPFSSSQILSGFGSHLGTSFTNSPKNTFSPSYGASPASLLFAHNNTHHSPHHFTPSQTPPTPSLLSAFSANTLLSTRRLRLIASMFSQMCEAVAVCHESGVSHRDIKPENFICCDSVELESAAEGELDFGPQAKRKVVVKLTDFGLATTEEESGDVECGSKPYMSYECRNNLGPTYYPPAADVWSLGIVLINMLFHRNPWKDPTEGDPNFDNFLRDPTGFLLAKFTGIGREVAAYLACHVLCTEVEDRVTARDFGQWIKSLPEMIGGRKALRELKMARLETRANQQTPEKGLFAKSPIPAHPFVDPARKTSASALTSSAPLLSSLPPPASLAHQPSLLPTPDLVRDQDADGEEMKSATTIDEQPTPADTESFSSPDPIDPDGASEGVAPSESDARSLSTHKRRKRGVRKGKAAQAALAAAAAGDKPSQEERDAMLKELAQASQSLARHLSKTSRPASEFDATDTIDFPPLGTTPSQAAAAKKSKWKDMMKLTSGNPELAALARRVAERDGQSGGNWSAPAELQHNGGNRFASSVLRPPVKQTATISSTGDESILSTSFNHAEDEDWRAKAALAREELEDRDEKERAKKAQMAAQALTAGFEPMGAFGTHRPLGHGHPGHARSVAAKSKEHGFGQPSHRLHLHTIEDETTTAEPPFGKLTTKAKGFDNHHPPRDIQDHRLGHTYEAKVSVETASSSSKTYSTMSMDSSVPSAPPSDPSPVQGMNRPKLKGQIQSLAKMLSGLKTKGKD